jgi:hypothetical protein
MSLLDSRAPAAKFENIGTRVGGRVVRDSEEVQQRDFDSGELLFWDDGNKRMQLVVEVEAGEHDPEIEADDGNRTFYVKGQMLSAVKAAIRKSGSKAKVIEEGAHLFVTFVRTEKVPGARKGSQPKKIYEAEYIPPVKPRAGKASVLDDGPGGLDDEPPF